MRTSCSRQREEHVKGFVWCRSRHGGGLGDGESGNACVGGKVFEWRDHECRWGSLSRERVKRNIKSSRIATRST